MPEDSVPADPPKPRPDPHRRRVLGEAIKNARLARRYRSQARLADAAGISERSVAGAEAGEYVGRPTLAAIETLFEWPVGKTTAYLEGDDAALDALPARDPEAANNALKHLTRAGLTVDIVPDPGSLAWLCELRDSLTDEQFIQVVLQMTQRRPAKDSE